MDTFIGSLEHNPPKQTDIGGNLIGLTPYTRAVQSSNVIDIKIACPSARTVTVCHDDTLHSAREEEPPYVEGVVSLVQTPSEVQATLYEAACLAIGPPGFIAGTEHEYPAVEIVASPIVFLPPTVLRLVGTPSDAQWNPQCFVAVDYPVKILELSSTDKAMVDPPYAKLLWASTRITHGFLNIMAYRNACHSKDWDFLVDEYQQNEGVDGIYDAFCWNGLAARHAKLASSRAATNLVTPPALPVDPDMQCRPHIEERWRLANPGHRMALLPSVGSLPLEGAYTLPPMDTLPASGGLASSKIPPVHEPQVFQPRLTFQFRDSNAHKRVIRARPIHVESATQTPPELPWHLRKGSKRSKTSADTY